MPYCPNCGAEMEAGAKFCPSCGMQQGAAQEGPAKWDASWDTKSTHTQHTPDQEYHDPNYHHHHSSGHKYDEMLCLIICCCLSPIGALIYYLLADHGPKYPQQHY